jgi:F-box/leucine-rich repeat protein 2/20
LSISGVKGAKLEKILSRFTHLQTLNLGFLFDCSEDALALVGNHCPHLKEVHVPDSYKPVGGGRGLRALAEGCPHLEVFEMNGKSMDGNFGAEAGLMALAESCRDLRKLRLRSAYVTDAVMQRIASNCHQIDELDISFNNITDVTLRAVGKGLPKLRQLDLKHCKLVSGQGIADVAAGCPQLQVLHLEVVEVGVEGLTAIGQHSKLLEELYLDYGWGRWGQLSRETVATVATGCRKLRILSMRGSKQVDDEVLQGLARGCPSLAEMDLHACQNVSDLGLQSVVRGCKQLKSLVLSGTQVGTRMPDTFNGGLPLLNTIRLNGDLITDAVLKSLSSHCKELAEVYLVNCKVSEVGLQHLVHGCKKIKSLTVKGSPEVTGAAFADASGDMESLCLHACGLTDNGLAAIAKGCPAVHHLAITECRQVSAPALKDIVSGSCTLKELIIVGIPIIREDLVKLVKTARPSLKSVRVSRPDSPEDEYNIRRLHGGWQLPSWTRSASPPSSP